MSTFGSCEALYHVNVAHFNKKRALHAEAKLHTASHDRLQDNMQP